MSLLGISCYDYISSKSSVEGKKEGEGRTDIFCHGGEVEVGGRSFDAAGHITSSVRKSKDKCLTLPHFLLFIQSRIPDSGMVLTQDNSLPTPLNPNQDNSPQACLMSHLSGDPKSYP